MPLTTFGLESKIRALGLTVALASTIGCAGQTGPDSPDVAGTQRPLVASAKDWFRGLMFADGPVAEALPTIRENFLLEDRADDPKVLSSARRQIDDLVATVDRLHPGKLEALKTEFISGVRPRISAALVESSRLTREAIDASGLTAAAGNADQGLCIVIEAFFVITTVAYQNEAIAVNAAVAVNAAIELSLAVHQAVTIVNDSPGDPEGDFPEDTDGTSSALTNGQIADEVARQACLEQTSDASGEECAGSSFSG
jgi:SdpC family antimicrobial peptide